MLSINGQGRLAGKMLSVLFCSDKTFQWDIGQIKTNRLRKLFVQSSLTEQHFELLAAALTDNLSVREVDIGHNKINGKSLAFLTDAIASNQNIRAVRFYGVTMSQSVNTGPELLGKMLCSVHSSITKLELARCGMSARDVSLFLDTLTTNCGNLSLAHLDMEGGDFIGAEESLSNFVRLVSTLKTLHLACCMLQPKEAGALFKALSQNQSLSFLDMSQTVITWNEESRGLAGVEEEDNAEALECLVESLQKNTTLTHLDISRCMLREVDLLAHMLKTCAGLKILNLSSNRIGSQRDVFFDAVSINTTLINLNLQECRLGPESGPNIRKMLMRNKSLQQLNLDSNNLGVAGAHSVADGLSANETLQELWCRKNYIGNDGGLYLGNTLKKNRSLSLLNISSNCIQAAGGLAIAQGLKENKTLSHLDISFNSIKAGARGFGETLKRNNSLRHVAMSSCSIPTDCALEIVAGLKSNQSITNFSFTLNGVGDEFGAAMAEVLLVNESMTSLKLSDTGLQTSSAKAFAKALKINRVLRDLDLSGNPMDAEGIRALAEALAENNSLTSVSLGKSFGEDFIGCDDALERAFENALQLNGKLIYCEVDGSLEDLGSSICYRNSMMHNSCRESVLVLMAARFLRTTSTFIPKEIAKMLAVMLWNTRCDVGAWSK